MKLFCVFGNPIDHSKSPTIHQLFAKQFGFSIDYQKRLVAVNEFKTAIIDFFTKEQGYGANVTAPFKEHAFQLVNELSERAKFAGAVNTLSYQKGKLYGDNTDGYGLVTDILSTNQTLTNKRILLLGAGGAAKGVLLNLWLQQPKHLLIYNRTYEKAALLADKIASDDCVAVNKQQLAGQQFDIVINATSASLSAAIPDIPTTCLLDCFCYDMMYSKEPTAFLQWAKQQGASNIQDGLGMLVHQAAESFNLWFNKKPNTKAVIEQLRHEL